MRPKLLYVEGDAQLLHARASMLTQNEYEVSIAGTLTKALRLFRTFPFDLLLIGHTIAERERTALAAISKRINPRAVVLVMVSENEKQPLSDGWMTSRTDADLLSAVASLIGLRRSATAA